MNQKNVMDVILEDLKVLCSLINSEKICESMRGNYDLIDRIMNHTFDGMRAKDYLIQNKYYHFIAIVIERRQSDYEYFEEAPGIHDNELVLEVMTKSDQLCNKHIGQKGLLPVIMLLNKTQKRVLPKMAPNTIFDSQVNNIAIALTSNSFPLDQVLDNPIIMRHMDIVNFEMKSALSIFYKGRTDIEAGSKLFVEWSKDKSVFSHVMMPPIHFLLSEIGYNPKTKKKGNCSEILQYFFRNCSSSVLFGVFKGKSLSERIRSHGNPAMERLYEKLQYSVQTITEGDSSDEIKSLMENGDFKSVVGILRCPTFSVPPLSIRDVPELIRMIILANDGSEHDINFIVEKCCGSRDLSEAMVSFKANVDEKYSSKKCCNLVQLAARYGRTDTLGCFVKHLSKRKYDLNKIFIQEPSSLNNVIHYVCMYEDPVKSMPKCLKILKSVEQKDSNLFEDHVNIQNRNGETPLFIISYFNPQGVVNTFKNIAKGVKEDIVDKMGRTPAEVVRKKSKLASKRKKAPAQTKTNSKKIRLSQF
ncbi:hypothetical protein AKO1_013411 [Acrasis kona]|uniref:Uncharacterized protein n=1 Tax=Acrasis kona TaxID=1008807 RepID=A0AAW2YLM7_9EUKA